MNFIENANWRYATKKYDTNKKVSEKDINFIKEAINLAATSYGLQPFKVLIIENPEIRKKLQPASWGQSQIVDASHLFVFVNVVNPGEKEIDAYVENIAEVRGVTTESLQGFAKYIKGAVGKFSAEQKAIWTSKQTYLALGNLLNVAAELKIDATPIEGFEPAQYNEILGLTEKGLNASLVAAIGYRSAEDGNQHLKKVRKPLEELFEII
jgi:nitroreductase